MAAAIAHWLAAQRDGSAAAASGGTRGYQWKCLFLPEGSELRMHHAGASCFARVVGNDIVYEGTRVTPRQFTLAVAGDGRNAWRDPWLRLPGEMGWKIAALRRREIQKNGLPVPPSPIETMTAATACMSQALQSALALVEHAKAQALPNYERRVENNRRAADKLTDEWRVD